MYITLSTGLALETKTVSSASLMRAQSGIPDPEVPKFFIEEQNRWADNPFDPKYAEDLRKAAEKRHERLVASLLSDGVVFDIPDEESWLRRLRRYVREGELSGIDNARDRKRFYLLTEGIANEGDMAKIVESCCLIESRVVEVMRITGVTRYGEYIDQAAMRNSINTGIGGQAVSIAGRVLVSPMDEYGAATDAGLNWHKWRNNGYPIDFMEETVAYYRLKRLIEAHSNDAQQSKAKEDAKKK